MKPDMALFGALGSFFFFFFFCGCCCCLFFFFPSASPSLPLFLEEDGALGRREASLLRSLCAGSRRDDHHRAGGRGRKGEGGR